MKKTFFSLLFILTATVLFAQDKFHFEQFTLDNGLTVILNEDHTTPEVFGAVVCKAGGKNDPDDATGMAHYQEHMLFKGTEELGTTNWQAEKQYIDQIFELYDQLGKTTDEAERQAIQKQINEASLKASEFAIPNETSNLIKSMGGTNLNAGTGWDMTLYYNSFPPNQIEKWIELYSHRFMNPVFRGFQAELEVVYEEKNMYNDMFIFPILEKFNYHFFKNHPYGQQTLIGTADDLKNPSLTKMYEFYKTYYVANNMAVIICGDFDTETVKPMIEEKFGQWESGEIPEQRVYEEQPFEGREFHQYRLSPIKLSLFGFRSVPNGHPDEAALDVCNALLANSNETGLLDQLASDNKILAAQAFNMPYIDHGASVFLVIPKVFGQSLKDAEELVFAEIERLKQGDFEDWLLQAVKNQLYVQHQQAIEDLTNRASMLAGNFVLGKKPEEILTYPEKINALTKDDIVRVANEYFTDNFLAFYSKMGRSKTEDIPKPGYEPVISENQEESEFAKQFESIGSTPYEIEYIDMDKAVTSFDVNQKTRLFYVENPINDIFEMELRYKVGEHVFPQIDYINTIMNYTGAGDYSSDQLKAEFNKIGCNYYFSYDYNTFSIHISGMESNLEQALQLLSSLINNPVPEQSKISNVIQGEKTTRKMERSEPDNVADALFEYVRYGQNSSYLDRLTMKEVKDLQAADLVNRFKEISRYQAEIHFTGSPAVRTADATLELIKSELSLPQQDKEAEFVVRETNEYDESTVFVVNKRNARQSKIYFWVKSSPYDTNNQAVIEAFNMYFGGGFSGLVLQEVREYRSLAYAAGAWYSTPQLPAKPAQFVGYIGTQSDKTLEAVDVFHSLLYDMPEKSERMNMITSYLTLSQITERPGFRNLSSTIQGWKRMGYTSDPAEQLMEAYSNMTFDDILKFYKNQLQSKNLVIAFVGNTKEIETAHLEEYGKVVEIKEKDLFSK